jgi:hypothetical protein
VRSAFLIGTIFTLRREAAAQRAICCSAGVLPAARPKVGIFGVDFEIDFFG